jgi:UDP-N-acetylglucosamine 3-dehydrogenase
MLRAGVIGLGQMGKNHLRVLNDLSGVSVVGVVDPLAKDLDFQMTIEKLISLKPDYCVVSVPSVFHLEVTMQLIDAGIHFLIEKPMSLDSKSANQIISESERSGVKGAVGYIERSNSAMLKAKELLQQGFLGNLIQISTRRRGPNPLRIKDVGVTKDLATHDFDGITWLTGMNYKSVYATCYKSRLNGNEDLVSCVGTLESAINATSNVDWITPTKIREISILGQNGALKVDTLNSDLIYYQAAEIESSDRFTSHLRGGFQGDITNIAFPKKEALQVEHENFVEFLEGKPASIATLREGLQVIKVAEAALLSCELNELVYL